LGTSKHDYFDASPDNDKEGQSIILVGDGTSPNFQRGFYGFMQYPVSIIFSANLDTIDNTLLLTEDFTEHLMLDVREALTRDLVGKSWNLTINLETREFDSVYSEFDINTDVGKTNKPLAPMAYFRFDCTLQVREDCTDTSLDRCAAITQNLTTADKNECILPTYDFSTTAVQDATTAQQQSDMTTWLCQAPDCTPANEFSMQFLGSPQYITSSMGLVGYDLERTSTVTMSVRIKPTALGEGDIVNKFGSPQGWFLRLKSDGSLRFVLASDFVGGNAIDVQTPASAIVVNVWQTVHVVFNGNSLASGVSIYVDNVLQTLTVNLDNLTGLVNNAAEEMKFGANVTNNRYYVGHMDTFRMWNIAFNATQRTDDYAIGVPLKDTIEPANIIANFRMGEESLFGLSNRHFYDSTLTSPLRDGFYYSQNMPDTAMTTDIPT